MFLVGIIIGSVLCIPIGPNGLVALSSTASSGYKGVLGTAVGASIANLIVAIITTSLVFDFHQWEIDSGIIRDLSCIFLMAFSLYFFTQKQKQPSPQKPSSMSVAAYIQRAFTVGICNPKSLLGFPLVIFSTIPELNANIGLITSIKLGLGVFFSSVIWWCILYWIFKAADLASYPTIAETLSRLIAIAIFFIGIAVLALG